MRPRQLIAQCREAGFREIILRGDTDFSQTKHLDRWDRSGVQFVFGYDACQTLKLYAETLEKSELDHEIVGGAVLFCRRLHSGNG